MMVDTLTIARELKAADLPAGQAEAIAAAIGRSIAEASATEADVDTIRVTLKADLELAKQELRTDIAGVRTDMERIRNQLVLWFVSLQIALVGLIIALVKL